MIKTELTRFRVKQEKSRIIDEWLRFLTIHMSETLATLEAVKMYVETVLEKQLMGESACIGIPFKEKAGSWSMSQTAGSIKNSWSIGSSALILPLN